jgi:hypothetical protein
MKKGVSLLIALSLMFASYGCIWDHRGDAYRSHEENREHKEYREHEEHRNDGYEKDHHDNRDQDEHGDYSGQH